MNEQPKDRHTWRGAMAALDQRTGDPFRRCAPRAVAPGYCPSPADSSAARRILTDRSLSAADGASMAAWWRWEYYCHWSLPLTDPPTRPADRPACRRRPQRRIFTGNTEQFTARRSIAASLQEISCTRTVRLRTGIRCMKSECTSTSTVSWGSFHLYAAPLP